MAIMLMPKAAIYEDHGAMPHEHEIGLAGHVLGVQTKS
jgi:hypothetical protein